jgi:hypothetical protein
MAGPAVRLAQMASQSPPTPWHAVVVPLAQIFSSYRLLAEKADQLEREVEDLKILTAGLESDRFGLQAKVHGLEKEILEHKQAQPESKDDVEQPNLLKAELDELRVQYDKLGVERAVIEADLIDARREANLLRKRAPAPPGDVSSPITSPNEAFARMTASVSLDALDDRVDLPLDEPAQLRLLGWLGEHGSRFPFQNGPAEEWRYHTGNGHFGHADAALLFSMLLEYKPSRLIEIGGGFSSLLVMDVNDGFLERGLDVTFFDQNPDGLPVLLTPTDAYRERVQTRRSQDVAGEVLVQLGRGDVLSLETSNAARTGNDVCDFLFRILPSLAPGVLVHIHDIYYPFESPGVWAAQDHHAWNPAYLLRAFLQFNSSFRVLFFNDLMARKYPSQMAAAFPGLEDTQASSIWLEKIG